MRLSELISLFARVGCNRLYAKPLAENDNSKNQVYFGPDFTALSLFPNKGVFSDSSPKNLIYKAKLDFNWLDENGGTCTAPGAQLILYPQYPEVRFSGFLQGCANRPGNLFNGRLKGRVLFLGVTPEQRIIGYAAAGDSELALDYLSRNLQATLGVFIELPLPLPVAAPDARIALLHELCRIHRIGWIDSKRLDATGKVVSCNAPNCGGYTLEAELGIIPNGRSEPDFLGYEVKQHNVTGLEKLESGRITLLTPEPTGGVYKSAGVEDFIRRYGYPDKKDRADRLNFGGVHRVGAEHPLTKLTLTLIGYSSAKRMISDEKGRIALIDDDGVEAASWDYAGLMTHWARKHARAVYVPSIKRAEPPLAYQFGRQVRLAKQPDFLSLLNAFADGAVFYDPGIKLEQASTAPSVKRRSQFRIESKNIPKIYTHIEAVDACA